mgnify:FL=1
MDEHDSRRLCHHLEDRERLVKVRIRAYTSPILRNLISFPVCQLNNAQFPFTIVFDTCKM